MTHEEILTLLGDYVDYLIANSSAEAPITNAVVPILPYLLSFAAGAMIYVVVEELIPESQSGEHSNIGTIGVTIGFVIMMILDVALG